MCHIPPDYLKAKTMHSFGTDFSFNYKGLVLFSRQVVLTLCDPMPSLSVPHHLPEFAQVYVQ